ncbi:hypothetical protein F511_42483 [Dorcoceras hygrometricum]|uniref:Uncharacterized protein n=1 Tax=Dorcoceras hygrometricum TaxID=472368 RepID=A0A2Z7B581_9LAMI|nr:hypothetical protein F511_42483 [Dorcoceras hygrometricum]
MESSRKKADVVESYRESPSRKALLKPRLDNQLQAYRYHQLDNQSQATAHPVESFNEPAVAMNPVASFVYPFDMESSRKKADVVESYNPDARYPVAVFEVSAVARNQRSRWKESMAEIESCKLPEIKGTRFVLFWEIVKFTEERCTEMERRRISLDKRKTVLESTV